MLIKLEMRRAVGVNAFSESVSVSVRQGKVFLHGGRVDVDLPPDTAAVSATVGYTYKIGVIFRCVELHMTSFYFAFIKY